MVRRCLPLAFAFALLSACATHGRDQDHVRSLLDEAAARANAPAQHVLCVRPFVLSIDAAGVIGEWGCDPGFDNIESAVEADDTMRLCLERAYQKGGHRAIVHVGYDLGPDGTAGEMILAVWDVAGRVSEQRRPLVRRARLELSVASR